MSEPNTDPSLASCCICGVEVDKIHISWSEIAVWIPGEVYDGDFEMIDELFDRFGPSQCHERCFDLALDVGINQAIREERTNVAAEKAFGYDVEPDQYDPGIGAKESSVYLTNGEL